FAVLVRAAARLDDAVESDERLHHDRAHIRFSLVWFGLLSSGFPGEILIFVTITPNRGPGCTFNRDEPPRLQRCLSFSSASSHRKRVWLQRNRGRLSLWSERPA